MRLDWRNILNLVVVFAILAALTAGVDLQQFKNRIKKPKGISIGLLCQFGILPVSAFTVAYIFKYLNIFVEAQGVALIILGSCPGGNISNIFCFLWNADLSLSIAMTTASSILSFIFLTANCAIYIPIFTQGSDTAQIDYISLAFSVTMVVLGIFVGFLAAYYDNNRAKKGLGIFGFIATLYMIWTALFGNATGSQPIWELEYRIWLAPLFLCLTAWLLSFCISILFRLPKRSVLTVCLESANQNSILSAAIIYLSLDEYSDEDIDFAIGIPIMYTLTSVLFDGLGGLFACQLGWVNCDGQPNNDEDTTVTLNTVLYNWRRKRHPSLLTNNNRNTDDSTKYGGMTNNPNISEPDRSAIAMTFEGAKHSIVDDTLKSSKNSETMPESNKNNI